MAEVTLKKKITLKKTTIKESKHKISIDDIKDIKVQEIKVIKKTGIYKLVKEDKISAITILNPKKITGYKLKGKNKKVMITGDAYDRSMQITAWRYAKNATN